METLTTNAAGGSPLDASLSLWEILGHSFRLYAQNWRPFTRVLLLPVLKILGGLYACLIVTNAYATIVTLHIPCFFEEHPLLSLVILLILVAGGLYFFIRGCWEYLLYTASLNRNAWQAFKGEPIDIEAAYRQMSYIALPYKSMLGIYCALPLIAGIPLLMGGLLAQLGTGAVAVAAIGAGMVLMLLLIGVWLVALVFLSLIFQVAAFESVTMNPLPAFMRSANLVLRRFPTTLGLQVILLVLTNGVLTVPVAWLFRLLRVSFPLDWLHIWMLDIFLKDVALQRDEMKWDFPDSKMLMDWHQHLPDFAAQGTDTLVMLLVTMLLLPLGTIAFTLLYQLLCQTAAEEH